jgi:phosphoglycolate phosphatase
MKNTVVWDMDGTILNTLEDLKDSVNHAVVTYGFPPYNLEEIRAMLGNGIKVLMELAVPGGYTNPKFDECFETFRDYYQQHMNDKTRPYAGIPEVMQQLKKLGYKQAIVSNKIDNAVKKLAEMHYPFVDLALGESEGLQRKPQPDMVWKALDELKITKENAVYIGDSEVDLATAQNSQMDCISVAWGFRDKKMLESIGAKTIVEYPEEIIPTLEKM